MAFTTIQTNLVDTAFGTTAIDDSICMLVAPAAAEASTTPGLSFALGTPYLVTSLKEFTDMGPTEANNAGIIRHVREFFGQAQNGAKLWVVGYAGAAGGDMAAFINDELEQCVRDSATNDYENRPRIIGVAGLPTFIEGTSASDPLIPAETTVNIQALQTVLSNLFHDTYRPFRTVGVLDALMINCPVAGGINSMANGLFPNLEVEGAPRVALQITTSTPGTSASIGQTLGKCASVNISTSIGITTAGSISAKGYFIDSFNGSPVNTDVATITGAKAEELGTKQYLFTRIWTGANGVYYNDDATCNDKTMALSSIKFARVGNAVCDDVAKFFISYINQNASVTNTGDIEPGFRDAILASLDSQYLSRRRINLEVNDVQVTLHAWDNNLLSTRTLEVEVRIQPRGVIQQVYIETFFVSDLTTA